MIIVCKAVPRPDQAVEPISDEDTVLIVHHATAGDSFEATGLGPEFLEHWFLVLEEVAVMYHPEGDRWKHLRRGCC